MPLAGIEPALLISAKAKALGSIQLAAFNDGPTSNEHQKLFFVQAQRVLDLHLTLRLNLGTVLGLGHGG